MRVRTYVLVSGDFTVRVTSTRRVVAGNDGWESCSDDDGDDDDDSDGSWIDVPHPSDDEETVRDVTATCVQYHA